MSTYLQSDRECTIDGVGVLKPGEVVEVNEAQFRGYHGVGSTEANFPAHIVVLESEPEADLEEDEEVQL